jgi:hypothetical protein
LRGPPDEVRHLIASCQIVVLLLLLARAVVKGRFVFMLMG